MGRGDPKLTRHELAMIKATKEKDPTKKEFRVAGHTIVLHNWVFTDDGMAWNGGREHIAVDDPETNQKKLLVPAMVQVMKAKPKQFRSKTEVGETALRTLVTGVRGQYSVADAKATLQRWSGDALKIYYNEQESAAQPQSAAPSVHGEEEQSAARREGVRDENDRRGHTQDQQERCRAAEQEKFKDPRVGDLLNVVNVGFNKVNVGFSKTQETFRLQQEQNDKNFQQASDAVATLANTCNKNVQKASDAVAALVNTCNKKFHQLDADIEENDSLQKLAFVDTLQSPQPEMQKTADEKVRELEVERLDLKEYALRLERKVLALEAEKLELKVRVEKLEHEK